MSDEDHEADPKKSRAGWLWRRPKRWFLFGIPVGGFIALLVGAGGLGAFNYTVSATNSLAFCTSCHEMQQHIFPGYSESSHFSNASGVRAICSDCHVPKSWWPKLGAKVGATFKELPSWALGRIDSDEDYAAHRPVMAERVLERMRANDSRECRSCHTPEAMALVAQSRQAQRRHAPEWRERTGETCIDCHRGVVHGLPDPPAL